MRDAMPLPSDPTPRSSTCAIGRNRQVRAFSTDLESLVASLILMSLASVSGSATLSVKLNFPPLTFAPASITLGTLSLVMVGPNE